MRGRRSPRLYARAARAVLGHKELAASIVLGSLMHALGHAFLAGAGGALARALAGGAAPMDGRSMRVLSALGAGDALLGLAVAGLFAAIAKSVGRTAALHGEARVAGEVGAALRLEVLDRVLAVHALHAPRHDDHGSALTRTSAADIAALTSHVHDVERGVADGVLAEVRALVQLVPLGVLLVVLAPRLAGSAALALAAFGALVFFTRRALRRAHARAGRENEALLAAADEAVRHAELWATYGAERKIRAHLAALGHVMVRTSARLRARAAALSGTSEVLGALALVLTLALASAGAFGGLERGAVVPFAVAFFMAYRPLRELVEARLARARGEDALAAMRLDGDRAEAPVEAPARRAWRLEPLVLEGVRSTHGKHAPLSLRVPPGAIAAVVGPTGSGKSSLLRALLGLEALAAGGVRYGRATLDGRGVGPSERPFAWVPQDAPVLAATLAANVALGRPEGAEQDGAGHLAEIGAGALVAAAGDATLATERPVSGGERQWIAIARALATDLPVLLLDEPTSALDAAAQARVLEAVARLRGRRTVVLVTHRPEPLAIADVVVRLVDGEDRDDGAGGDLDDVRPEELAVEDVGALALAEAERQARPERVDAGAE